MLRERAAGDETVASYDDGEDTYDSPLPSLINYPGIMQVYRVVLLCVCSLHKMRTLGLEYGAKPLLVETYVFICM